MKHSSRALHRAALRLLLTAILIESTHAAETQGTSSPTPGSAWGQRITWGRVTGEGGDTGLLQVEMDRLPGNGELPIKSPFPNITAAFLDQRGRPRPLSWKIDPVAGQLSLLLPREGTPAVPAVILMETSEKSGQAEFGRITFSPANARLDGGHLKLVNQPGDVRVTSWTDTTDSVEWEYKPSRWGMYDLELAYSADAGEGTVIKIECAGQTYTVPCRSTGGGNQFSTVSAGRFHLSKAEKFVLRVSCGTLKAGAGLNLKAVTLRPAPEGQPVVQDASGAITLHAGEATTHSVLMRYEPAEIKNCLGYWANPKDWADWDFTVTRPGVFEVEVWQGCGKGQGGSDVAVEVDGQRIDFIVEETGHFQVFLPRRLGRVRLIGEGRHTLAIKPQRRQAGAVMDVRQVRLLPVPAVQSATATAKSFIEARRVLFLGDSITYAGEWVEFVEAWIRMRFPSAGIDIVNLGLPSETVSGLSEAGHAGGAFPRPDVHERLDRALAKIKPDLVVVCYGMNDGIYFPFGEERFRKFQEGMIRLRAKATAAGAKVIHVTPPVFDPTPLKGRTLPAGLDAYPSPFGGYNTVLDRYSDWLTAQRAQGWEVVDVHGPMNGFLATKRRDDPAFILSGDGVHPNSQGHWLMARELLRHLGVADDIVSAETVQALVKSHPRGDDVLKRVQQRQRTLKDAWLTDVGHLRPGMRKGDPLADAERAGRELLLKTDRITDAQFPGKRSRWLGFERFDFEVNGRPVLVVAPKIVAPGRPWAWHGEFFGHKPAPDLALLGRGFHIVYTSAPDMLGCPDVVAHWNAVHKELTGNFGFAAKAALVGLSRGGLYVYNWAIANPGKVACIYGDAPVCDFKSWPGGKGKGPGSARDWQLVLDRYHFRSEAEAIAYPGNPVDNLARLANAHVPLLHVYGDADEVVPWDENTGLIAGRYRKLGGSVTLIAKPGVKHHPHGLDDPTPIVDFIWTNTASAEAKTWLARHGGGPLDADAHPLIRRLGTIDLDLVETTPVVLNGRLWRFEWIRQGVGQQYWDNQRQTNYFRFRDPSTGEITGPFADGHEFGSAFVKGDTVYVTGTQGRDRVNMFASRDLKNWETWSVIQEGRYGIFNTSICQAGDEFVIMFEIDKPVEEAGTPFTARFARSGDLREWKLSPPECNYARDRYTAPHCLRWRDGWFYDFHLEAHQGYEMRVVRSRDLVHWEASPLNPVLRASPEDKLIANPSLSDAQRARVANARNLNNSDIDFCEWQGHLVINYSWGNQLGIEHLAEAVYDGSETQFLQGWFPGK
jgi:lysophospholipase L1-like esterase